MTCAVCGRDSRGFAYRPPRLPDSPKHLACSMTCLNILTKKEGRVADLTKFEIAGLEAASRAAGAYLETESLFDLTQASRAQWAGLIKTICITFTDTIREKNDSDEAPF